VKKQCELGGRHFFREFQTTIFHANHHIFTPKMEYTFSYFHLACAFAAILIILMYSYPLIFYIFLFVLYSLILVVCGKWPDDSSPCVLNNSRPFPLFSFVTQSSLCSTKEIKRPPLSRCPPLPFSTTPLGETHFLLLPAQPQGNYVKQFFFCSSRMFDIPKRTKANMPVIFGRTIDNLLQQILGKALDDFVNSWLG
jgi:hypothetical protein